MSDENKALIRRYVAALNRPNWMDLVEEFLLPEHIGPFIEQHIPFRVAFPDYRFRINDLIAEGEKIVVIGTVTATHEGDFPYGEFKFVRPSGKQLQWREIWVGCVREGKLGEGYILIDVESRMQQLGLVTALEQELH